MLIKHGELQPLTVINPADVNDEQTKIDLQKVLQKVKEAEQESAEQIKKSLVSK